MSVTYSLSNKYAKKFCKWTVLVQLIVEHVVTYFYWTRCIIVAYFMSLWRGTTARLRVCDKFSIRYVKKYNIQDRA